MDVAYSIPGSPDLATIGQIAALLAEGLVVTTAAGEVVLANAGAFTLLGLPLGESHAAVAAQLAAATPIGQRRPFPVAEAPLVRAARTSFSDVELCVRVTDGERRLVSRGTPISVGGVPHGALALQPSGPAAMGPDERRRLEELREDILAIASHELKNPLTVVLGYGAVLARAPEVRGEPRLARAAGALHQQSQRMRRLLDLLLDFSRLGLGRLAIHQTALDLAELAPRVIERERPRLPEHAVALRGSPVALVVSGDVLRLEQVLAALIGGAARHTPPGETVAVTVRRAVASELPEGVRQVARPTDACALLQVVDAGAGTASDARQQLFINTPRPAHTDSALAEQWLGMYVCARLIAMHGGALWFEQTADRRGVVNCALPLVGR
jgi:signal transduction histidine kinase